MKKLITLTLCIAMILALAACGTYAGPQEDDPIIGGDPATWGPTEYETLAEAAKACGFDFSVPDTVFGYQNKLFTVFNNGLIQVIYYNEDELKLNEEELNNMDQETVNFDFNSLIIRKAAGNDDTVNVAIWTNNDYTFAVTTNNSMSSEQISELIKNIQ